MATREADHVWRSSKPADEIVDAPPHLVADAFPNRTVYCLDKKQPDCHPGYCGPEIVNGQLERGTVCTDLSFLKTVRINQSHGTRRLTKVGCVEEDDPPGFQVDDPAEGVLRSNAAVEKCPIDVSLQLAEQGGTRPVITLQWVADTNDYRIFPDEFEKSLWKAIHSL